MMKIVFSCLLSALFIFLFSCEDEINDPPTLQFITETGYTSHDTLLGPGKPALIGIKALGGSTTITNLTIKSISGAATVTLFDTGVNCAYLNITKMIYKSLSPSDRIVITVMDKCRKFDSLSLILQLDTAASFGSISYFPSVYIAAQENTQFHHCLSVTSGHVFPEDSASLAPGLIDILYYYNPGGGVPIYASVFSSPGENDAPSFYPFINSWPLHNSTYYNLSTTATAVDFNLCTNDSLLIASYDEANGKRKFKNAAAGQVIPFKIQNGRKGLILIKNIQGMEAGYAEIAIKVQH